MSGQEIIVSENNTLDCNSRKGGGEMLKSIYFYMTDSNYKTVGRFRGWNVEDVNLATYMYTDEEFYRVYKELKIKCFRIEV
jgi:hypothetical protein